MRNLIYETLGLSGAALEAASLLRGMRDDPTFRRRSTRRLKATDKRYPPNSERECARRRRQIAAGRLTAANGLAEEAA